MKNVVNVKELDAALLKLAKSQEGVTEPVIKWITTQGKKWLLTEVECFRLLTMRDIAKAYKEHPWMLNAYPQGTKIWEFDEDDLDFDKFAADVQACVPYLVSKIATGQKNIQPIPFEDALEEGHKMAERVKAEQRGEQDNDKELVHKYPNGWAWWSLTTPKALRRESNFMGHCVGNSGMGYGDKIANGQIKIFSLRDAKNEPHCTIEYVLATKRIAQLKGAANRGIVAKYKSPVVGFLKSMIQKGEIREFNTYDLAMSDISAADLGRPIDENGRI